jgi:amidohydrolase
MLVKINLVLALVILLTTIRAQTIDAMIEQQLPDLLTTFKTLHSHPELSHYEKNTAQLMAAKLRDMGYEVTEQFGQYENPQWTCYGIVAMLKNGPGPTVLFRADMDALPIEEKTGLSYCSTVKTNNDQGEPVPLMHACGHDMHCTVLLGIAQTMMKQRKGWSGTLLLIVQPAEEVNDSGGWAIMRAGLYEKFPRPDYTLAFHVNADVCAGDIRYVSGNCLADVTSVDVTVFGVGGHGAAPHKCIDPVVLSSQIVLALQTIVSREINPLEPAVVTVGSIHGGTARNIIPEKVVLELTLRCYKKEVRERMLAAIERICLGQAKAAGVPDDRLPQVTFLGSGPAVYNNPELTSRVKVSMEKALGKERLVQGQPVMGAEDFSAYSDEGRISSALFWLGITDPSLIAASQKNGTLIPAGHSPRFTITPEPAIRSGVKGMSSALMDLLKKK